MRHSICLLPFVFVLLPIAAEAAEYDDFQLHACGPIALSVCAALNDRHADQDRIAAIVPTRDSACTLLELHDAAERLGLVTRALKWHDRQLADCAVPAIVQVSPPNQGPHFIVAARMADDHVQVIDYPHSPVWISRRDLRDKLGWDGTALHIAADPAVLAALDNEVSRWTYDKLALVIFSFGGFGIWLFKSARSGHCKPTAVP